MAMRSGFFNALRTEADYDRKYNANDYSDNLAVVISNGVLRSANDDLKVTGAGMAVTVGVGRGWINGHWCFNDAPYAFPAVTAPTGGSRYDRVMLRLNKSLEGRNISLVYVEGTAAQTPTKPAPTRSGNIYDLVLADVFVQQGATSVVVTDTRSDKTLCGWVYSVAGDNSFFVSLDNSFEEWFDRTRDTLSSVTLFKKYTWTGTMTAAGRNIAFDIPQYDPETCFVEVYVNGVYERRYNIADEVLTFEGTLIAGTVVTVNAYKSIDGTGIMTVADEITQLQNQFATLDGVSKFVYKCTGLNDNIALSEIAQALYNGSYTVGSLSAPAEAFLSAIGGNTYLASLSDDAQVTVNVTGVLGATTPYAGSGTVESRYRWFSLGVSANSAKRIIFDFAKCDRISIACSANTHNIIFFGTDVKIRNANVFAVTSAANCTVTMIVGSNNFGRMFFEDCVFKIITTGKAVIAHNGTFVNCWLHTKSTGENSYCIDAKTDALVQVIGGSLLAYTGTSAKVASVFNVDASENGAVIMAQNINASVIAQEGYRQNYLCQSNGGMTQIYGVCGTLPSAGNASYRSINGQIQKNKQ